ncbi:MAG: glycosyltransferase family 39 protein [Gemmatimonadota bacterium]
MPLHPYATAPLRRRSAWILAAIMVISTGATVLALRRNATTFDEIVLISAGARGYTNGKFDLAPDHPPAMQYLYGLPVFLSRPNYPSEAGYDTRDIGYRYLYARQFFWQSGNDPERAAFLGRLPAALCALLLVLVTFAFTRRAAGTGAALLAAALVAFLPDVLAHGGVSYNDVPLALTYFLAVWALDRAVRLPDWRNALLAGVAVGLALGVKLSAIALGPVACALLALEAVARRDRRWALRIIAAVPLAIGAAYLMLVLIYRGDFGLEQFRYALDKTFRHVTRGHGAAGFLLGKADPEGFWYFFPVAFLFKTSAALHALAIVALLPLLRADYPGVRALAAHPLRVPVVAAAVFGAALLTSSLNIGFRYALPVLPHICVLIAAGVTSVWNQGGRRVRALIAVLVAWLIISPLTYYPNFLTYISEYGPRDRGRNSEVLVDSSLDWGQGLLQLREYMRDYRIERVYLSYFGSAQPDGYGIDYVPLHSFFPLAPSRLSGPDAPPPTHIVISATNLQGVYFTHDPFARFRDLEPEAVVANSMYVYRIQP